MKIKTALISVSDKNKLYQILKKLRKYKIKLISSGGTYKKIVSMGFECIDVSDYTNFPEILDGRVKTLHPKIHSGILYKRNNKKHKKTLKNYKFESIDLVITNFYPFKKTIDNNSSHEKIIENIDIGGPTLVRSAAKNYNDVIVITRIDQYKELINELELNNGSSSLKFRTKMSKEAFCETASYDAMIYNYFNSRNKNINDAPKKLILNANLVQKLRYGENPHQFGAIYSNNENFKLKKLQGKDLSYNNYNDIFASINLAKTLPKNRGVVIIKHANPCGVAIDKDNLQSYKSAVNCDPVSAFGGIVSCNYRLSLKIAKEISKNYYEVIIANGFDNNALRYFKKKKNLRLIDSSKVNLGENHKIISGIDAYLTQSNDNFIFGKKNFKVVSKIKPSRKILDQLLFSFNVCRSVKSNAIVIAQDNKTVGIGSGQPSRLDSCTIAIDKMNKFKNYNSEKVLVAASDAFFPFVDGIEKLVQAGVTAIIQPYGSIRDKEIIRFANEMGIILVFSKTRHFNH